MPERAPHPPTASDYAAYWLYKAFVRFIAALPRDFVLSAARRLGSLLFYLDGKHRNIALDNLERAFGKSMTANKRRNIALRSFQNFAQSILDSLKTSGWSRERLLSVIDIEGRENLERAQAKGRGVLLFTAHFGNWEIIVPTSSSIVPFHVIARPLENPLIDRDIFLARTRHGATIINKLGAGRPVFRALGRGDAVGILIDQNVLRREAVFVDFFTTPAATTPALAVFHIRTGAAILPMFCLTTAGNRYRMRFDPPLEIPLSGTDEEDVLKITRICTKIIEREIQENPALWLWIHKRWQSRPSHER